MRSMGTGQCPRWESSNDLDTGSVSPKGSWTSPPYLYSGGTVGCTLVWQRWTGLILPKVDMWDIKCKQMVWVHHLGTFLRSLPGEKERKPFQRAFLVHTHMDVRAGCDKLPCGMSLSISAEWFKVGTNCTDVVERKVFCSKHGVKLVNL